MAKNYYSILGVSSTASDREIRQAYRKLARRYHPDLNPGQKEAEEKFKAINEAHEVLSSVDNRRKYDHFGENWKYADRFRQDGRGAGPGSDKGSRYSGFPNRKGFEDIFQQFFGGNPADDGLRYKRSTIERAVEVTLEEAYLGCTRIINIVKPGPLAKRLEVRIPPGVDGGDRIHLSSTDDLGSIDIVVKVKPHRVFQRKGKDLYAELSISLVDAVLGAEVRVPTVGGVVALTIHPETQNGRSFRLKGQGMPSQNKSGLIGDLYVTVKVVIPSGLSDTGRELFRQLKAMDS